MRHSKLVVPMLVAFALLLVPASSGLAQEPDEARKNTFLQIDDLVTASGKGDVLIRLRPRSNGRYKVTKVPLGVRLTPKAITSNKFCEKIAIANAHNVVVVDVWTGAVEVIENEAFGEIADVQYDWGCNLIIADMGMSSVGIRPRDGRLWMLRPNGTLTEIGWRHKWSNPAFLEMDEWGTLYVVDRGAGPKRPGSSDWHYDVIYKLGAPKYTAAVKKFGKKGLDVSSFVHHPSGKFFIGNQGELLILENDELYSPCGWPAFNRINGLAINANFEVFLMDGFDVFGTSALYQVDEYCNIDQLKYGRDIEASQGLSAGLPRR